MRGITGSTTREWEIQTTTPGGSSDASESEGTQRPAWRTVKSMRAHTASQQLGGRKTMRKILKAVAKTFGILFVGVAALGALLTAQAYLARHRRPAGPGMPIQVRSWLIGRDNEGTPLELAMVGDSLAAGLGADEPSETVGVLLARGLAAASERPVQLRNVAIVGSESKDLAEQVANLTSTHSQLEVVVIIVGGNDVLHLQRIGASVQYLATAVRELRSRGCEVVVGTCPDMGTVRLFAQPLRFLAHFLSRLLATAQTIVVLRAGGRTVSLADTVGPIFTREPTTMFSTDQVHPSSQGYARAAEALLPSVCAAAGFWGGWELNLPHRIYWRERHIRWMAPLAFWAVRHAGAEVSPVPGTEQERVHVVWRPGNPRTK